MVDANKQKIQRDHRSVDGRQALLSGSRPVGSVMAQGTRGKPSALSGAERAKVVVPREQAGAGGRADCAGSDGVDLPRPPQRCYTYDDERKAQRSLRERSAVGTAASVSSSSLRGSVADRAHESGSVSSDWRQGRNGMLGGIQSVTRMDLPHAVMVVSPTGGVGVSALASVCALELNQRRHACALVDLDCMTGGLDVLLGLEAEPGLRWSGIQAPLGRIEAQALRRELPQWEGMPVLSADSWNHANPEWWEVQAALTALHQSHDVMLMDAGHNTACLHWNVGLFLLVVELNVLGLARARGMLAAIREQGKSRIGVVAMRSLTASKTEAIDLAEAEDYLGEDVSACLAKDQQLGASVLSGLGVPDVPRKWRKPITTLATVIEESCELDRAGIAGVRRKSSDRSFPWRLRGGDHA